MSDSAQEKATDEVGVTPVQGHQGGVPPTARGEQGTDEERRIEDEATSSVAHKVEPRAGRDT